MDLTGLFFGFSNGSPYLLLCLGEDGDQARVCLVGKPGQRVYPNGYNMPTSFEGSGVPEGYSLAAHFYCP